MWNPFSKTINESNVISLDYSPTISGNPNFLTEQFKGEIELKKIKFPAELGEEHPYDFSMMDKLYEKFGLSAAIEDKYIDFVWGGGFYVSCDDARALEIIEEFNKDVNMDALGRQWTREGLRKGNGFLELGGTVKKGIEGMKILNANYMYVNRDKQGKVLGYNQYTGAFEKFSKNKTIPFTPTQIAHFSFNRVGDCAYGIGIHYAPLQSINNMVASQKDLHWLMHRKANTPLHAKLGKVDGSTKIIPKAEDVKAFGQEMETMDNKSNWATDALVELSVVDFGNFGDKFSKVIENDLNMIIYEYQVPGAILGMANVAEGLAEVNMEAFQRRIQSIQAELEHIIEEQIYKRVLNANGFDVHVEFNWGTPDVIAKNSRLTTVSELVKSPTVSIEMKSMLEDELIDMLDLDKDEWEKLKAEQEERLRLEAQPQPIVPGQNAGFPQKVQPKAEQPKQPKAEEMLQGFLEIMIKMEEKRNEYIIKQQESAEIELERKREKDLEFVKSLIFIPREKEVKVSEEQKIETVSQPVEQPKVNKVKQKLMRKSLLPAFRICRKESVDEGWVTGDDGRHYYIDKDGNSYSGKDAMSAAARDKKLGVDGTDKDNWKGIGFAQMTDDERAKHKDFITTKANDAIEKNKKYVGNTKVQVKDNLEIYDDDGKQAFGTGKYNTESDKITIYNKMIVADDKSMDNMMSHEIGHAIYQKSVNTGDWVEATSSGNPVSNYAKTNAHEDFAESFRFFNTGRQEELKVKSPTRFKFIQELLK